MRYLLGEQVDLVGVTAGNSANHSPTKEKKYPNRSLEDSGEDDDDDDDDELEDEDLSVEEEEGEDDMKSKYKRCLPNHNNPEARSLEKEQVVTTYNTIIQYNHMPF